MKEIIVLSGKGGTGKTTVTAALAVLMTNRVVADCDVDAADLHLVLAPDDLEEHEFRSGVEPVIDREKCSACGTCVDLCHFHALALRETAELLPFSCEGCGVCAHFCPEGAITLAEKVSGTWFVAATRSGPMIHARLGIGEENSGKLVALVKRQAREAAERGNAAWLLVDGPPGIGCPVIASLSGADFVLLVTEPTRSGLHDLARVAELAAHFRIRAGVCINKWDLHPEQSREIEAFCQVRMMPLLGRIPFDRAVVESIVYGRTLPDYASDAPASLAVRQMWRNLQETVEREG